MIKKAGRTGRTSVHREDSYKVMVVIESLKENEDLAELA